MTASSSMIHNRLTVSALTTLLDARKDVKSSADMRRLCNDFNCDEQMLRRLTRYVTSPSLSLQKTTKANSSETYLVSWLQAAIAERRKADRDSR